MFIQCSDCDYKYIVNSADLKPDGRMVECANCNHRWFQEPLKAEKIYYLLQCQKRPKKNLWKKKKKVKIMKLIYYLKRLKIYQVQ